MLLHGEQGRGGDFYAAVRALWTHNPFNGDTVALYLLVQWSDPQPTYLEQPLITSVDWADEDGNSLIDCRVSDPLRDPANWTQATGLHEDQVEIEIYSDATGAYPADKWRWGAGTTDPITPVNPTEVPTAGADETMGATLHPPPAGPRTSSTPEAVGSGTRAPSPTSPTTWRGASCRSSSRAREPATFA